MLEKVNDACAFALETRLWDMVPGGDVLDDLQLLDWPAGDILSSNDSSTGDGGIPGANWHLPEWGCKSPLLVYSSAQYPSCPSPLLSSTTSDAIDKGLVYPAQTRLTTRTHGTAFTPESFTPESFSDLNIVTPQSCFTMGDHALGGWASPNNPHSECNINYEAPSLQLVTDSRMPLTGTELDMRSISSPAELPSFHDWMSTMPNVHAVAPGPLSAKVLPRSQSTGCSATADEGAMWLPKRAASTGSDDSSTLLLKDIPALSSGASAKSQAFPLLSHADLGVQPMLFPLPSALEIMPLSSGLATEALTDFQTALFQQEPEPIIKLPALPDIFRASLLDEATLAWPSDAVAPAGNDYIPKLPSLPFFTCSNLQGRSRKVVPLKSPVQQEVRQIRIQGFLEDQHGELGDIAQEEANTVGAAANAAASLVLMEDPAGVNAAHTEPEMPKEASAKGAVPAVSAAQLPGRDSDWEEADQDMGMPEMFEQATVSLKPRRAAKRAKQAQGTAMVESGGDSQWERDQALHRPSRTRCRAPKEAEVSVPEAVLRNRVTQRQYLQRKKGKMAAVHAHVPELKARLAQLQAELAPLVERHQTLTETFPWTQQLDEIQFMASLGDVHKGLTFSEGNNMAPFLLKYIQDPIGAYGSLSGQVKHRKPDTYTAVKAGLPRVVVPSSENTLRAGADAVEELQGLMPDILTKLRLTKRQKEQLAVQGKKNATVLLMQHEGCSSIASALQDMLTGSVESTHVGWRCSLLTHVLCGQLAGLERCGADVDQHSTSLCTEVLSASQAAKLAHLTGLHPSACTALCEEIKCQRCGPKLPVLLPTLTTVPKASHASTRLARMLPMTDITSTEGTPWPKPPTQQEATESHHDVGPVSAERVALLDSAPESAEMAGTVVTSGILDSSAAKPAAHHAAVSQDVSVPKRARPADIEGPPQWTKTGKGTGSQSD